MIRNTLWVAAMVGTLGVAGAAQASPGPGPGPMLEKGPTDVQKVLDERAKIFAQADANGDGKLDAGELSHAFALLRAEHRLQRLDANGDGGVSVDEFNGPTRHRLAVLDRNGDGTISPDEMRRAWHENHERRGHRGDRCHGDHDGEHQRGWDD